MPEELLPWKPPKGTCDSCYNKPAVRWFGMTAVALCTDPECWDKQQRRWDEARAEEEHMNERFGSGPW